MTALRGIRRNHLRDLIYLDNAATMRMKPEVFEAMRPYFEEDYANASGIYAFAVRSGKEIERARETVAHFLGAEPGEIYFTGGGTEADNWALKGAAFANREKGRHIVTSGIEHHAVLNTCRFLEKQGFEVTYLDVDENGMVTPDSLKAAIRPDTILISVMFANNEIGTIEPVKEIGEIAKERHILFHTDAVQAYGHIPIDVEELHIDMLSASGHKFGGPKGVGILYLRNGVKIEPLLHGGAQESGKRAGTCCTPGVIGFAKATELAAGTMAERAKYEAELRDHLIGRILAEIPDTRLNGHREKRLPNHADFCFRYIEGEALVVMLDMNGICASSGSACTSGSPDPSHVLLAIGLSPETARGSLRLTLSEKTTKEEIDAVVEKLKEIVGRLRSMSPEMDHGTAGQEAFCQVLF